jgi:Uma2 family endonuclease
MHMATAIKRWTLEELHSLPDDGNCYELIHGELFVTPPPADRHETIAARLSRILDPYVAAQGLGYVYRPRAVVQTHDSQLEPDLMVRQPQAHPQATWREAPLPALVVEILSPYTRRRNFEQKREFYVAAGIAEYWIVDPDERTIRVIRKDEPDTVAGERLTWSPKGTTAPLTFEVPEVFGE